MDIGFVQGKSDNLPRIDSTMTAMYLKKNSDFMMAEIRGIKAQRLGDTYQLDILYQAHEGDTEQKYQVPGIASWIGLNRLVIDSTSFVFYRVILYELETKYQIDTIPSWDRFTFSVELMAIMSLSRWEKRVLELRVAGGPLPSRLSSPPDFQPSSDKECARTLLRLDKNYDNEFIFIFGL
ncbi:hypothetical protein AVEN_269184-1 [Araneus ventricosus]|uniref:Uncharacterized protein n=1 Tax=Araneus ventricosus TaxID=182803 RepID=A0A4Y2I360_ARAVE|nr:hypothetical protein AVEN_269184-1 [Araneus ventricosus]